VSCCCFSNCDSEALTQMIPGRLPFGVIWKRDGPDIFCSSVGSQLGHSLTLIFGIPLPLSNTNLQPLGSVGPRRWHKRITSQKDIFSKGRSFCGSQREWKY